MSIKKHFFLKNQHSAISQDSMKSAQFLEFREKTQNLAFFKPSWLTALLIWTFQEKCFSWTFRPISQLAENLQIWHCDYWKCLRYTSSSWNCQNDSFIGALTGGSGNSYFLCPLSPPQVKSIFGGPIMFYGAMIGPQSLSNFMIHFKFYNTCDNLIDSTFVTYSAFFCQDVHNVIKILINSLVCAGR